MFITKIFANLKFTPLLEVMYEGLGWPIYHMTHIDGQYFDILGSINNKMKY